MSDPEQLMHEVTGTWDYTTLPPNIRIGDDCFFESPMPFGPFKSTRDPGLVIGNRVRIFMGGWGGALAVEAPGLVEIGDDTVLVGAQIMSMDHIAIGDRVTISYNAIIADADFHPRNPIDRRKDATSGAVDLPWTGCAPQQTAPVVIEEDVVIGINAVVLKGVHVGAGARVEPGAVVTRDVPAGATSPATRPDPSIRDAAVEDDWYDADLPTNVELAPTTYLYSGFAFNHYRSRRTPGVRIGEHTAVYDTSMFDLGPAGQLEIGRFCVINGSHFVGNSRIVVGDYVYTSYEVFVSDDGGPSLPPAGDDRAAGEPAAIVIGDDCWLGLRSVVLPGAHLHQGVIVGAGAVVDFEVPPFAIVAGNPARIVGSAPPEGGELPPGPVRT